MLSNKPFLGSAPVIQGFGDNPKVYNQLKYAGAALRGHNGIDFSLALGTSIHAVRSGKVANVGNDPEGFGKFVLLEHAWGQTIYGHLSHIDVRQTQQLNAADQIGLSGSSGVVSEPQLHFGMRVVPFDVGDGWCGFSDPSPYLERLVIPAGPIMGPHIIGGLPRHLQLLTDWQPRLALILDPNPDEVRTVRAVCPNTTIIGRIYLDAGELVKRIYDDPKRAAEWAHQQTLSRLPSDVDYWQAANEILQHGPELPLLARFEQHRMSLAERAGYRCAILGFSVGNPDLPDDDRMEFWRHLYTALEQAEEAGHIVALHQYGMPNLWGPNQLYDWYVHRLEHQILRLIPFKKLKFAVTEFGIDGLIEGNAPSGWRNFTDPTNYVQQLWRAGSYLERFSGRILGYCVFTLGHNAPWNSYDIAGATAQLLARKSDRGTWPDLNSPAVDIVPGETDTTVEPGPHIRVQESDEFLEEEDGEMNPIDELVDRRLSQSFLIHNLEIRTLIDRPDAPEGDIVYIIKDVFTTRNGSWEPEDDPAAVPEWARRDYLRVEFMEAGANHHLFAAVLDVNGQLIHNVGIRYWSDGYDRINDPAYNAYVLERTKMSSGWANLFIGPGSGYHPQKGEQGPWCWMPEGPSEIICGGGLPQTNTISTFVVWQAVPRQAWDEWVKKHGEGDNEPESDGSSPDDSGEDKSEPEAPQEEEPADPTPDSEQPVPPTPKIVRRVSPWIDHFNLTVKTLEERPDGAKGDILFIIKDIFTTRQGSWTPSELPGAVPDWARADYLKKLGDPDYFDDAGADHHLFAAVLGLDGKLLRRQPILYWSDGFEQLGDETFRDYVWRITKERSGWANIPIGPGSSYVPERNESGPWCWAPVGAAEVMCGGGLPLNHHISVFVVWQAIETSQAGGEDSDDSVEEDSTFLPVIDA